MILLNTKYPATFLVEIATRVRQRRLELNLSQEELAKRAGMKLPTYRKFEQTGIISFERLLNVAFALNCLDDFDVIFTKKQYTSIDEVINEGQIKSRKRGKTTKQ